jgi:23S rRNA pseudouridine2605 synthase
MRIHKFLAQCGVASRRNAEELIKKGRVTINGEVVTLGALTNPEADEIRLNGKVITPIKKGVAIFNKPAGVVSTLRDPHGRRTIGDFIPDHLRSYFPVGRLDFESIGLVILTNDGDLADRLLHPKYVIPRKYHIRVVGIPSDDLLRKVAKGVKLEDGVVKADARFLREVENAAWLEVILHVGKNRVVRRIFEELGYPVQRLKRVAHGPFNLGDLQSGKVKELSQKQYLRVREMVFKEFGAAVAGRTKELNQKQRSRVKGKAFKESAAAVTERTKKPSTSKARLGRRLDELNKEVSRGGRVSERRREGDSKERGEGSSARGRGKTGSSPRSGATTRRTRKGNASAPTRNTSSRSSKRPVSKKTR